MSNGGVTRFHHHSRSFDTTIAIELTYYEPRITWYIEFNCSCPRQQPPPTCRQPLIAFVTPTSLRPTNATHPGSHQYFFCEDNIPGSFDPLYTKSRPPPIQKEMQYWYLSTRGWICLRRLRGSTPWKGSHDSARIGYQAEGMVQPVGNI